MRSPVRSYSPWVGYSTRNDWPISCSRSARNIASTARLQSIIRRWRDSTRPIGANSKAVR